MNILRLISRIFAVPILAFLMICRLFTAVIMNVYSIIHGILWLVISAFAILTICFGQWHQLIAVLLIGMFIFLLTTLFTAVEVLLDEVSIKIRKYIFP